MNENKEHSIYQNPLSERYAGEEMLKLFSDETKFKLWRKVWIALAEAQHELGLNITNEQILELKEYAENINYDVAKLQESKVRHDVMAHIYAFGVQCPKAAGIIHLGATSCDITDNAEIIILDEALKIIRAKLINVIDKLAVFADKYKKLPTLGLTHLQPAQLTTVGKRAALWIQDLMLDLNNLDYLISNIKLRGIKGTTGTQASFMQLFDNDLKKVKNLEKLVINKLGYKNAYDITGQTYPRKFDYNVLSILSKISQSAYKFSNDLRILQSLKEVEEPFEKAQIGSSAMAYKRNPMRSERIAGLARYVITLPLNASITSSTQWFERTLDDSANKRIVLAQAFLAVDAILNVYLNIAENIVVYEKVIKKHVMAELPFMATESILMECVKSGANRQDVHEKLRVLSMEAAKNVKENGLDNNLIELIKKEKSFSSIAESIDLILSPENFIGASKEQVEDYLAYVVNPVLNANKSLLGMKGDLKV